MASFFVKDLVLALAPRKCVPTNRRPSKRSIIDRHLLYEEKKMTHFCSGPAASGSSKAWLYNVSRKYSENRLHRTNVESNLTPEIECTLEPSNYVAKP